MRKVLYAVDGIVEAVFDPSMNCIIVTWTDLGPHEYVQPCLESQIACVKTDGAKVIIVDTADSMGELTPEQQSWLGTHAFPAFQRYGLKAVITVIPKDEQSRMAANQWQITGSGFGFDFVEVATLKVAQNLAKMYAAQ